MILQYTVEEKDDGWYYEITNNSKLSHFKCSYGPFVGPESAEYNAGEMVNILQEEFNW